MEVYSNVIISRSSQEIASFLEVNSEFLLGILAALSVLYSDITMTSNGIKVDIQNRVYVTGDSDMIMNFTPPQDGSYWWIGKDDSWSLYNFVTYDFIEAFIQTCQDNKVDFRDYSADPPFVIVNGNKQFIEILGYDISRYSNLIRIGAPVIPFFPGVLESDPYGLDYE